MDEKDKLLFISKTIKDIYIDRFGFELLLEDNTKLEYSASDGGYSTYTITKGDD